MPHNFSTYGLHSRFLQWFGVAISGALVAFAAALPAQAAQTRVVAFGDSLSAGYELAEAEAFPAQLQRALIAKGLDVVVNNASVSGETASDGAERLDWSVPEGTDLVILELGANDMLRGLDPQVTQSALSKILARLKERKISVLLCGMKAAPNMGADYAARFEAVFADLAVQYQVTFYPFFLEGMARDPALTLPDGMHPNAKGVGVIVDHILPAVQGLLRHG